MNHRFWIHTLRANITKQPTIVKLIEISKKKVGLIFDNMYKPILSKLGEGFMKDIRKVSL